MTWTDVATIAAKHLGNPRIGCPDCGTITTYRTETGHTAYYPGVECCPAALRRQITWRHADIDNVKRQIAEREQRVNEAHAQIETAAYREKAIAEARAERAKRNLDALIRDKYSPQLREYSREISRLKRKLAQLEAATAPHEAPRPRVTP